MVVDRIREFWADNPDGRIITELISIDPPGTTNRMAIVKASVYTKDKHEPTATGIAKEREGTFGANKTAFLENCETSAIGRALANLGILTEKNRPSREEMEAVKRTEEEHTLTLEEIKRLAKALPDPRKNQIKKNWGILKDDPVAASKLLLELNEALQPEEA